MEGCRLKRDIPKDQVLTYDDVELPAGRLADQLRAEQYRHFRGETWLAATLVDQEPSPCPAGVARPERAHRDKRRVGPA